LERKNFIAALKALRHPKASSQFEGVTTMTMIHVPRPKNAFNPNRPVSALLRAQMEYLREAEKRLPLRYHSDIYVNAVRTEGEAAKYIRHVTEAIHEAHEDAATRARVVPKRKRVIEIAAVADEAGERRMRSRSTSKKKGGSRGRKK
jgi:hypothetical protein